MKLSFHPELIANAETYRKIADFEAGCIATLGGYLLRYGSEKENEGKAKAHFDSRLERLRNDNFVRQYLRLHLSHLSQPMTLSGVDENERLSAISKNATGFGWSYSQAFRERLKLFIRDGRVATLVDSPVDTSPSDQEAKVNKEQSYEIIYPAAQIVDWSYFDEGPRRGELKHVVFPFRPHVEGETVFRQWRRFSQPEELGAGYTCETLRATTSGRGDATPSKMAIDVTVVATIPSKIEGIPVVMLGFGPSDSFVRDIAEDNRAHLNLQSVLDNVLYYGGMQKHIFAGMTREEIDKWGEASGILTGSPDAQVFTISPVYPQGLLEVLRSLEVRIHRRGKFQFNQLADDTRQVQSAESKSQDLAVQKDVYDQTLDLFTEAERLVWQHHARFEGVDPESISVTIGRDYGFEDPVAQQAKKESTWNKSRELGVVSVQKQILKGDVLDMPIVPADGQSEEDARAVIMAEIDAAQGRAAQASSAINGLGASLFGGVNGDQKA